MKPSIFNVYRPHGEQTAVYNTLTGRWRSLPPQTAERLRSGDLDALDDDTVRGLVEMQALVDKELDERIRYRSLYQQALQSRRALSIISILTYRCNLRCPYCFEQGVQSERTARMSDRQVGLLIDAIKKKCAAESTRQLSIMLFGGEPLLETARGHRILRELSVWCRAHRIAFAGSMSTNGTLLTPQRVSKLAPYLKVVQVTFDGPKDTHDQIRVPGNKKPTYDKIVRGIQRLLRHRTAVNIRVQVTQKNQDRIPELLADLAGKGLVGHPGVQLSLGLVTQYSGCGECDTHALVIDPRSELGRRIQTVSPKLLPRGRPVSQILPCVNTGNVFCVDPRGRLFKCITAVGELDRSVGRIDNDAQFALNDHYYEYASRDPLEFAQCAQCDKLPLCGGGCPTEAYQHGGNYRHPWCGNGPEVLTARIDSAIGIGWEGDS